MQPTESVNAAASLGSPPPLQLQVGTDVGSQPEAHLLLLYKRDGKRTYHTVRDEQALCDLILQLCEEDLARKRGMADDAAMRTDREADSQKVLQYDAADLLNFMDAHLTELVVLKFNVDDGRYDPEGRDWLKNRIYQSLLGLANAAEKKKADEANANA
eukprot:CAMPEP_0174832132 /NCGR_PEP_ID=MMETSP1114-20130205/3513_1 /TAXON_ID=312471 /ORGANISM="Neobodo designis, Strain CCAP 1951/1" /LENGTH=157 /DNA_ID=CAMNT_0016065987 /DNA_START=35 /DNA_END=508 /DNA_ORIENTATION=-